MQNRTNIFTETKSVRKIGLSVVNEKNGTAGLIFLPQRAANLFLFPFCYASDVELGQTLLFFHLAFQSALKRMAPPRIERK